MNKEVVDIPYEYIHESFAFLIISNDITLNNEKGFHDVVCIEPITGIQQLFILKKISRFNNSEKNNTAILKSIFSYLNIKTLPLEKISINDTITSIMVEAKNFISALTREDFKFFFEKPELSGRQPESMTEARIQQVFSNSQLYYRFMQRGWIEKYSLNACFIMYRMEERDKAFRDISDLVTKHMLSPLYSPENYKKEALRGVKRFIRTSMKNLKAVLGHSFKTMSWEEKFKQYDEMYGTEEEWQEEDKKKGNMKEFDNRKIKD